MNFEDSVYCILFVGFPCGLMVKNPSANAGDMDSISGLGGSTGGCNGNPLQHSWWENSTDRGAWWAVVHRVTKELDTTHQLNNNDSILFVGAFPSHFLTAAITEAPD